MSVRTTKSRGAEFQSHPPVLVYQQRVCVFVRCIVGRYNISHVGPKQTCTLHPGDGHFVYGVPTDSSKGYRKTSHDFSRKFINKVKQDGA